MHKRIAASQPQRLEDELSGLDTKIERTLDLGIELGDLGVAKDRLRSLRIERERVVRELAQSRFSFPTADELLPRLREKLRDLEATLRADVARGRLALGGLLGESCLRVYADGRIEGSASLTPEMLAAPRRTSEPRDSVVAGGRFFQSRRPFGCRSSLSRSPQVPAGRSTDAPYAASGYLCVPPCGYEPPRASRECCHCQYMAAALRHGFTGD